MPNNRTPITAWCTQSMSMIMELYRSFPFKTCPFEVVDIPEYHHAIGIAKLDKGGKERKACQKWWKETRLLTPGQQQNKIRPMVSYIWSGNKM